METKDVLYYVVSGRASALMSHVAEENTHLSVDCLVTEEETGSLSRAQEGGVSGIELSCFAYK